MRPFYWKIVYCVLPVLLAAIAVTNATFRSLAGEGGFKLGVDLVGGTILVYEVDQSKFSDQQARDQFERDGIEKLAAALKRRIDPSDLYNVTIRPVGKWRVEIILPTGGSYQARLEDLAWQNLLVKAKETFLPDNDKQKAEWQKLLEFAAKKWPPPEGEKLEVPFNHLNELADRIEQYHKTDRLELLIDLNEHYADKLNAPRGETAELQRALAEDYHVKDEESKKFLKENYAGTTERKAYTTEEVDRIKALISQVGSLKFLILANSHDDQRAIDAAKSQLASPDVKATLDYDERKGLPPPGPRPPEGHEGFLSEVDPTYQYTYSWVEMGREFRHQMGFSNDQENGATWKTAETARKKHEAFELGGNLFFSREVTDVNRLPKDDRNKKYEYFVLVRDPERGQEITGQDLTRAEPDRDSSQRPAVGFHFNSVGADRFLKLTSKNMPLAQGNFKRQLAVVLDEQIRSAPTINARISGNGIIEGNFTPVEVDRLVNILRAGALPATLKQVPVSENTIGPTLGAETIQSGMWSVGIAFAAVLIFMLLYYRFAGLVACVALLANLLLTIAFMVLVNATFTLPGLAGLVLMLGMAVDANVLIYERIREERERGASLALAIRNGYDRAFPVIIDTHLSSIFTAIVLYAVGNDQLKGFGISLTVGLIISLFTSLYMTRLLFDVWLAKGWLHKLSMGKLFSRPNIDFMAIRYYWFTATIILTILGASVFIYHLDRGGLNIDFVGGTAYTGQLKEPVTLTELRSKLSDAEQQKWLRLKPGDEGVKEKGTDGRRFQLTYAEPRQGQQELVVDLPNKATPEEVRDWAQRLPDLSIEQIFLPGLSSGDKSAVFNLRTTEKAAELVEASIDRLLGPDLQQIKLKDFSINPNRTKVTLSFADPDHPDVKAYASPAYLELLIRRQFEAAGMDTQAQQLALSGKGFGREGRYNEMELLFNEPVPGPSKEAGAKEDKLAMVMDKVKDAFNSRPQPLRLENFDKQLAADTQQRAMYAILMSWGAILLYLWFRFGNWTFGVATVLCLIHDLFFTLGAIAVCHYIHLWWPGVASALMLQDFKIDLPAVAALLTLVGYSVNDTIVVFDRIREVRGKNPELTPQMINDSVNQTLSRTLLTALTVFLVVFVLYIWGGEGLHLFAFVMVVGVVVGTYSSIYIASPLLLIFGEGAPATPVRERTEAARA
jgi:SecD/SecF fusion protein